MLNREDKPFTLLGGSSEQVALANRIACIDRIRFLSGVDLREKSKDYIMVFELTLWQKYYRNEPPDVRISEEYCQRSAEIIKEMEAKPVEYAKFVVDIEKKVKSAFALQNSGIEPRPKRAEVPKKWWEIWKC